jgi:hypothetical protein
MLTQVNCYSLTMSEFPETNRYPDIVCLKLSAHLSELRWAFLKTVFFKRQIHSVDLKLTLRFGTQTIRSKLGSVRVGLKRGRLRLTLKNARMPLEEMGLVYPFAMTVDVERQKVRGHEYEGTVSAAPGVKTKDANQQTDKVKYQAQKVYNRGSEIEPTWTFEANPLESPYLLGQLTENLLGKVEINSKPAFVFADFTFSGQRDLHLEGEGGLWPKDLARDNLAVIERLFFRMFIEPKLQPFLSQIEFQL